ncbi:DUF1385 domain-containing protein [Peptoniphilus sp. BV3C26]|nr:DUF1385 domain-containing protein [Peptoniphilus sp. BV3C26]
MEKIYNKNSFKTTIGGQALIEGVMMKGPSKTAMVVRKPDGQIQIKTENNRDLSKKYKILKLPIIRGAYRLIDAMVIGVRALNYSASFYDEEENKKSNKLQEVGSVIFSLVIAILFFMILPSTLAGFFKKFINNSVILNLIEGLIRLIIFFTYLFFISKLEDIKRVFMYHGSEHRTIHCYEAKKELTVENVQSFPIVHPRCGTSFLFMVMIISILVLSFFGWPNLILRFFTRILAFPLIAGISYEINRFIGKSDSRIAKVLSIPGLAIQKYFTVKEPTDDMVEVAISSLKEVLPKEGESDLWK